MRDRQRQCSNGGIAAIIPARPESNASREQADDALFPKKQKGRSRVNSAPTFYIELYCSRIDAAAFGPALKAKPKPDAAGSIRRGGAAAQARSDVPGGSNSDIFVFLSSLAR